MPFHLIVFSECWIQESDTDSSATSGSSGEMKPKSLKTPDGLEGDKQRQSADGAGCPPSSQPEAGKGPQKKPLGKQRDQKGSEGLEVQGKLGARNMTLSSKRSPALPKVPREKEKGSYPGVRLRRNASSAGRLQGLTSGSFAGSPGRRETKISEVCLPSGKKRPKSLELTISPEETGPLNPETLLLQEKMNTENPNSATTASEVATLKTGPTATLEKGSRNPEHATTLEGTALRNTPFSVPLAGKTMIGEHLEPTAPAERSGTGALKASSVPHEPSDPEVSLSSGKKGPPSPEDLVSLGMMTCAGFPLCVHSQLFVTLWTVARQTPLSMEFPRQEHWSGWPFPTPGHLPNPGIKPVSLCVSCAGQTDSLPLHHLGRCTSLLLSLLFPFHWTLGSTLRASIL